MDCQIEWHSFTRTQWDELLHKCVHVPLLQSYYYAQAMRETKQQGVRHGLIKINGADAGIVQMQEVSLLGQMIQGISIDRGPCWFDGFGKIEHINAFAAELDRQFPDRFARKRRFMPEYFVKNNQITFDNWKKMQKSSHYMTFLVDLSPKIDDLRSNLKKNWRNILNNAEKNGLAVEIDENLSTLGQLLKNYIQDRLEKRYAGASPKFLATLAKFAAFERDCLILNATEDDETIASIMVFVHGRGATYQIGWTTPYGRDKGAHHLLLWEVMKILKSRGVTAFDLGGHNDDTDGIRLFKSGLGGQEITLIGSYN